MTATDFTNIALAWIAAVGTISVPAFFLASKLIAQIKQLKAQALDNTNRIDAHDRLQNVDTSSGVITSTGTVSITTKPEQPKTPTP